MGRFRSLLPTGRHTGLSSTVLAAALLVTACGGVPAHAPEQAASAQPYAAPAQATGQTALDRYVAAPDPHFAWKAVRTIPARGVTATVLEMTSQQWLTTAEVQQPIWTHWLIVARPERVTSDIGLLYIGGGANDGKPPEVSGWLADFARDTGTVVAELRMVPNQPVVFTDDPERKPRYEDDFVAYTWNTFLRTGDDRWPARLPMTKAAVRAMDAITAFIATPEGGAARVERFVVSGGSKRGWTTWTTAAVDRRVIAIAPAVIDLLHIEPSFVHHWRAYGFWAPAIQDYVDHGIMDWRGTPEFAALMRIVEPYEYRGRLAMPKFILNAAGDEFFLPDSWQFYFDDLPGEKHLRYVPNTGHGLDDSDAIQSLHAFYSSIVTNRPRPSVQWRFEDDGTVRVTASEAPLRVRLWQATNPSARDFRIDVLGPQYRASDLQPSGPNTWAARVEPPAKGWTAYFVELTFPSGSRHPFTFTTGVRVTPDTLPHPPPPTTR
jgi:PhoPQ-activated pathogenicity-related protein